MKKKNHTLLNRYYGHPYPAATALQYVPHKGQRYQTGKACQEPAAQGRVQVQEKLPETAGKTRHRSAKIPRRHFYKRLLLAFPRTLPQGASSPDKYGILEEQASPEPAAG